MNNNEEDKKLEKLSLEVADGNKIDWTDYQQSTQKDQEIKQQLSSINEISQAFQQQLQSNTSSEMTQDKEVLFRWGHLHVMEKIGEGSFGEVYKAYDSVLERDVALKLLKQDEFSVMESRAFIQEARLMAKVRNRHVLAIHGAAVHDKRAGMWTDLIIGSNLKELRHKLSYKQLITICSSLTDALIAVHEAGLIHGDIKLSNVMFDDNNKLILMDFGSGLELNHETKQAEHITGTLLYMAPELFDHKASAGSDVYAFGVLLFTLVTGNYPVRGKNIIEIQAAHKKGNYQPLKPLKIKIPVSLQRLIMQMIAPVALDRPTALTIKACINRIIRAPQRRNKTLAISAIIVTLLIGTIVSSIGFYRATQEKEKALVVSDFMQNMLDTTSWLGKGSEIKIVDLLNVAALNLSAKFTDQPQIKATMHDTLGRSYVALSFYKDSVIQYSQSLELKKQWLKIGDPRVLTTMLHLAYAYEHLSEHKKSIKLCQQVITVAKLNANRNRRLLQLAHTRLAQSYTGQGKYQQAEVLLLKEYAYLPLPQKAPENNGFILLAALAANYNAQSKYQEAEKIGRQALEWLQKHPKSTQNNFIAIQKGLAIALSMQGKMNEAEVLLKDHLSISEKAYGRHNIRYIRDLINLSAVLQDQGKNDETLLLLQQASKLADETQGVSPMMLIAINSNLANATVSLGDVVVGEQLIRENLASTTEKMGATHVETLKQEYNLAELLNNTQRYQQAQILATSTLAKMQQTLGATHLFTLLSQDNIAISLSAQKEYRQSDLLFTKTLRDLHKTVGEKSPFTLLVMSHHIDNQIQSGQTDLAIDSLKKLIIMQTNLLGKAHADTVKSISTLQMLNI